jgi:lipopolysaccharide transport system permease protein
MRPESTYPRIHAARKFVTQSDSELRSRPDSARGFIGELWAFRELLFALIERNLKMRFQRSFLGAVWTLLNPLLTGIVLVGVFSVILRVRTPQYWAFLISGYFAWVFTLNTLGIGATIVGAHSYMTRSVAFPPEVLVVSAVASRFVEFAVEMLLVVVVIATARHEALTIGLVALPFVMLLHALLTIGIVFPVAALGVFFEDVQHAVPVGLTMLTLVSPVYYPLSYVPDTWQPLLLLNPFASILSLYHTTVYDGRLPALAELALPTAVTAVVFTLGLLSFRWKRAYFAEIV